MQRTSALLKGPQAIQLARELRQETKQYGKRKPAKITKVSIITRRKGEPDRRKDYVVA